MNWQQYFPFAELRPPQIKMLDYVVEALVMSVEDIFLEGPTGVGKSAVAIALSRLFEKQKLSTYISTTTIALENQYMRDFESLGLRQLHSKAHYKCRLWDDCELGLTPDRSGKPRCTETDWCPYKLAKEQFEAASYGIANADFLFTSARFVPDFPKRSLLICDEAHALPDTIAKSYAINISAREGIKLPENEDQILGWLQTDYLPHLNQQWRLAMNDLNSLMSFSSEVGEIQKQIKSIELKRENIRKVLTDPPSDCVIDLQKDKIVITPLWASEIAPSLLHKLADQRIYMSATLPGFEQQARLLGIDPAQAKYKAFPSPFPVENRLIYSCPIVKWNYRDTTPAIEQVSQCLIQLLARHQGQRGLVHVSSYAQALAIVAIAGNPRLIVHEGAHDKEATLNHLYDTPGAVLVSPSSHEGLDLYGDRSQFQVIAKLPFAYLGDKRVKQRMEARPEWYTLMTAQKLIQACGRSVRSVDDIAPTYILDASFQRFFREAKTLFPQYFREAIRDYQLEEEVLS